MSNAMETQSSQSAKRPATGSPDNETNLTLNDVQSVVDTSLATHQQGIQGLLANLSKGMAELDTKTRRETTEQFQCLGSRISSLEGAQSKQSEINQDVRKELDELKTKTSTLEDQLQIAKKSAITREDLKSIAFDRPANLEIIKVNAKSYVSKSSVEESLAIWLLGNDIKPESYVLEGNEPQGKYFTVRFQVNPLANARMVDTALQSLKMSNGSRKDVTVTLPNKRVEKLHIGGDENDLSRTKRRMATCLKKALLAIDPELQNVHYKQYQDQVYVDDVKLCLVAPKSTNVQRTEFWWNLQALPKLHLEKEALLDKVWTFLHKPEEDVQWSL